MNKRAFIIVMDSALSFNYKYKFFINYFTLHMLLKQNDKKIKKVFTNTVKCAKLKLRKKSVFW